MMNSTRRAYAKDSWADYAGNDESQEGNNSVLAEMQMITIFANWQKLF